MSTKYCFIGSVDDFIEAVEATGLLGEWHWPSLYHLQFRSAAGAVLNFWPGTGTVSLQGRREPGLALLQALKFEERARAEQELRASPLNLLRTGAGSFAATVKRHMRLTKAEGVD